MGNRNTGVAQAPTIHAAMTARLARCLHSMQTAFCRMQDDLDPVLVGDIPVLMYCPH